MRRKIYSLKQRGWKEGLKREKEKEKKEEWQLHSVSGLVLSLTHVLACNKNTRGRRRNKRSTYNVLLLSSAKGRGLSERESETVNETCSYISFINAGGTKLYILGCGITVA